MSQAFIPVRDGESIALAKWIAKRCAGRGVVFATLIACTDARLLKTDNPYWPVRKRARVNVALNMNYTAAVNRRRARAGLPTCFRAEPRAWGRTLQLSPAKPDAPPAGGLGAGGSRPGYRRRSKSQRMPLVWYEDEEGAGKMYLNCTVQRVLWVQYLAQDGRTLSLEQIERFVPTRHEGLRQELEEGDVVKVRDYALANIEEICLGGARYATGETKEICR